MERSAGDRRPASERSGVVRSHNRQEGESMATAKKAAKKSSAKKSAAKKGGAKKGAAKKSAAKKAPAKKAATKKTAAKKTAAKRKPNAAFMKAMQPSTQLAAVVGGMPMPR